MLRSRLARLSLFVFLSATGAAIASFGSLLSHIRGTADRYPFLAQSVPMPHHVPRYAGGLSFRFAMAHDVLMQRFPRHGPRHYEERNLVSAAMLEQLGEDDPAAWPVMDDLAAGLERLHRSEEAVALMRRKLAAQQEQKITGVGLYTTYANLGTFLIHAHAQAALNGDAEAIERFQEGVEFVRRSVEVNPTAHFGREQWQAAIAEFLLSAAQNSELLKTFDCLGNRLDLPLSEIMDREANWVELGYGRPTTPAFGQTRGEAEYVVPQLFEANVRPDDPTSWENLKAARQFITPIGAEAGWEQVPITSFHQPVPFDEPMLGIIGMWRQGGGANPHFALAIGETMLRVGQRYLAWNAYERAAQLAERYSPDPALQQFLLDHCRHRQQEIEVSVNQDRGGESPDQHQELTAAFNAELAFGQQWQAAYQAYETQRIEDGHAISEPDFFADFDAQHDAIASPIGNEERYVYVSRRRINDYAKRATRSATILGAGCGAILPLLCSLALSAGRRILKGPAH
ncbi:MAG: hypothetical protein KDA85_10835 [Planctomycetaceae bacterium]|nr:hypothetical protein [Planctomycetaceae bacterium]